MTHARTVLSLPRSGVTGSARPGPLSLSVPPLPATPLPLTAEATLDGVEQFIDRLGALLLPSWLLIGRTLLADPFGADVRQSAWCEVEAAIAAHCLALGAWHVRDALETATFSLTRTASGWTRLERCQFAAARHAAIGAVLALLVRPHIVPRTVQVLCAPFAPHSCISRPKP